MFVLVAGDALVSAWVAPSFAGATGSLLRFVLGAIILAFLIRCGWGRRAGITRLKATRKRFWWTGFLPLSIFLLANLGGLDSSSWNFTRATMLSWIVENTAVGFVEEVLFRGFALFILLEARGKTRRGLVAACIVQALLFGPLHLLNVLGGEPLMLVLSNSVFATIVGVAFGAADAYSGSLWTCVVLHGLIDMAASANEVLGGKERVVETTFSLSSFLPSLVVVVFVSLLPSLWILYKAGLRSSHNAHREANG